MNSGRGRWPLGGWCKATEQMLRWVEMRDKQERGGAAGGVAGSSGAG